MRKLNVQAKICTPPGGEVIAKICVLRSKDLYSRIETSLRLRTRHMSHFFLSPPSGGGYVSHRELYFVAAAVKFGFLLLFLLFTRVLAGRMSGQLACYGIGARSARLRKFALPTPTSGQLAKICTGNLTGSELRKYALCQNHTIPVRIGRKTEKCKSQEMPPPAPTSTLSHTECSTTSGKTNECRITRYCTHNVFLKFLF